MAHTVCRPIALEYDSIRHGLIAKVREEDTLASAVRDLAQRAGFEMKEEFHITLIGYSVGARIWAALELLGSSRQHDWDQFLLEMKDPQRWSFVPGHKVWHIEEDFRNPTADTPDAKAGEHREAYIQTVSVPMLADFYKQIQSICSLNLVVPPTHITLCTRGNDPIRSRRGIGINSLEELEALNPRPIVFE